MKIEKIKPIPKYMIKKIQERDKKFHPAQDAAQRFYAYLTKNAGELVKVTVCCKNKKGKWYCKQVAVHGVDSKVCFTKDLVFYFCCGHRVGWWDEGLYSEPKWYEDGKWYSGENKYFDPHAPVLNPEFALKFKEFKYSAVDKYYSWNTLEYLRIYKKYPQAEYLVKMGLRRLVTSVQILKLAGKDRKFRKFLSNNADGIINNFYYISSIINAYKTGKPIQDVYKREKILKELYVNAAYQRIKDVFQRKQYRLADYLNKQAVNIYTYADYIRACQGLNLDMEDDKILFPKDFKFWHDTRIDEYATKKTIEDEKRRKEHYEKFASIANKYSSLEHKNGTFAVVIAKSPAELQVEGRTLGHCVGSMGYDQRFTREENLIFFLRNLNEIEKPFVTVEYSIKSNKILQCYGSHNTRPSDEIRSYLDKDWLPYTKKQLKKIA